VAAYDAGATLAVANYDGQRANPVLVARSWWPAVADLHGDVGVRSLMTPENVTDVDCTGTGRPDDVDTRDDLERIAREMEE